jgi:hypothetical protein
MFQWLRKAYDAGKRVLGKVRSGVEGGARFFNKGKEMYSNAKNFATNLPVIGAVASDAINRMEDKANEAVKRRVGVDFRDVNKAVSTAEAVAKYLPRG